MANTAKIIPFRIPIPKAVRSTKPTKIKNVDGVKYYTKQQIQLLRRTVRAKAESAVSRGNITAIKEWMVVDLLTSTGIRVSEAADLRVDDIKSGYGESAIFVRCGKGRKSRTVQIPASLKKHLRWYCRWKEDHNESVNDDSYIFIGQRGSWTTQAIQQLVKKYLKEIGIYERHKSVHAIRHSYACTLYSKEKDLKTVQKQLGHASIQTTQIYADVAIDVIQEQVKSLW